MNGSQIKLDGHMQSLLRGDGGEANACAMRIVTDCARVLGAESLVAVESAHIDGCLYHGDSGVYFLEHLVKLGGRVAIPSTLNVGALDLRNPGIVSADIHAQTMARRLMNAHTALGCEATWTCAPYQAGHRPKRGTQVAWAESNAVVFVNSVLGARSNRYGDFLDICMAICGYAPFTGLHREECRRATVVVDTNKLSRAMKSTAAFYPVLGAWLGRTVGDAVAVIDGLPRDIPEDRLKALGAGAAATGSVGLFHIVGVTPEAPDLETACQSMQPDRHIELDAPTIRVARDSLDTARGTEFDCVALGSPHFSELECRDVLEQLAGRTASKPIYICTNR
ncbi:MAG: aconitase X, partial [Pseudomonadota bacterium]